MEGEEGDGGGRIGAKEDGGEIIGRVKRERREEGRDYYRKKKGKKRRG